MKARPFLALVLTLALLAGSLGLGGWWLVWREGPLQLERRILTMPRTARFVPRHAPLSLYLLTDAERPLAYARAVAPPRQRSEAVERMARLRDGAFAAAGLDYGGELADWLGPEIGLAFFDAVPSADSGDATTPPARWLLSLSSRDGEGARRFLQRFWQTRSLAGADLQVSQYRGMGVISGRGAAAGALPGPLATALVQDDLVLIASGRGVLEEALDVSQIEELNQAGQASIRERLEQLARGAAVIVIRPPALERWFAVPAPQDPDGRSPQLVGAFRPRGPALHLSGVIDGVEAGEDLAAAPGSLRDLAAALWIRPTRLALLHNPAALLRNPLLAPLLRRITALDAGAGPLPSLVAEADHGPLLLADGPDGWLMGTLPGSPPAEAVEPQLAALGQIQAPLEMERGPVQVWTRLEAADAGRERGGAGMGGGLRASLAGWRISRDGEAWWGQSLRLLQEKGGRSDGGSERLGQLRDLELSEAPVRWALGPDPARSLLQDWTPWSLLSVLSGGGLSEAVQGASLALDPEPEGLRFDGLLQLG